MWANLSGPLSTMQDVTSPEGAIAEGLLACKIIIDVKVIQLTDSWGAG